MSQTPDERVAEMQAQYDTVSRMIDGHGVSGGPGGQTGIQVGPWPHGDPESWGKMVSGRVMTIPDTPSEHEMREIRERAISHAAYIAPEMGAFADEDDAYMARLLKTADRIADWIRDGV